MKYIMHENLQILIALHKNNFIYLENKIIYNKILKERLSYLFYSSKLKGYISRITFRTFLDEKYKKSKNLRKKSLKNLFFV